VLNPFRSEFYWNNWNNGWNFSYTNRTNTGWNNDWSWNDNLRGNDRLNDWDDNDLRDNQWRGNSRNDENLRDALQDLERAFERKDRRAMGRLIPRNGSVNIMLDGNFQYSLNADDFFDLFQDGISNVKTDRYEIVRVRQNRNSARVIAKHTFRDPWGRQQTNFQAFYLEGDRRDGYVIREFDTTNRL